MSNKSKPQFLCTLRIDFVYIFLLSPYFFILIKQKVKKFGQYAEICKYKFVTVCNLFVIFLLIS